MTRELTLSVRPAPRPRDAVGDRVPRHAPLIAPGSAVIIPLTVAIGLVYIRLADYQSSVTGSYSRLNLGFFALGVAVIFIPIAVRLTMRGTGGAERIALAITLGLALYVVKIEGSPHGFTSIEFACVTTVALACAGSWAARQWRARGRGLQAVDQHGP